jgi:stalled ribosome alternative rescue factor ArfA
MPNSHEKKGKASYLREQYREEGCSFSRRVLQRQIETRTR